MKVWELEFSCAAHSNKTVRFPAVDFENALTKARDILARPYSVYGTHGGYSHVIVRLDYVTEFKTEQELV